ncbi:hypothetical protein IRZ53_10680 [Pseudomonas fulva]|uniref:hypothetical protein n=1 Tax=Pseudomonas fulva TaxID=47880 RepID=UPI0018A95E8B|nr:hypothetical protein [Pseudomonas fulva]MBF8675150.1 hypothetical protein [Pseudomonas fulva]MBF8697256.1 hypothetical protein [Pseudomonas fulva]
MELTPMGYLKGVITPPPMAAAYSGTHRAPQQLVSRRVDHLAAIGLRSQELQ